MFYFNEDRNKNLKRNHVQSLMEENQNDNSPTKLSRLDSSPSSNHFETFMPSVNNFANVPKKLGIYFIIFQFSNI